MICYLDSQPDYYGRQYTQNSYLKVLQALQEAEPDQYLCIGGEGLTTAGMMYYACQKIKGILGFTDLTDETRVTAELLKFLFFGMTQSYLNSSNAHRLVQGINRKIIGNQLRVSETVRSIFAELSNNQATVSDVRKLLKTYCRLNQEKLAPSFWNRQAAPTIQLPDHPKFGDTYLALATEVSEAKLENHVKEQKMIHYYHLAAQTYYSNSPEIFDRLNNALENFQYSPSLTQQVVKVYRLLAERELNRKQYDSADIWLQKVQELDPQQYIEVCTALIEYDVGNYQSWPSAIKERMVKICIDLGEQKVNQKNYVEAQIWLHKANQLDLEEKQPKKITLLMICAHERNNYLALRKWLGRLTDLELNAWSKSHYEAACITLVEQDFENRHNWLPNTREQVANVCLDFGRKTFTQNTYHTCFEWLNRANKLDSSMLQKGDKTFLFICANRIGDEASLNEWSQKLDEEDLDDLSNQQYIEECFLIGNKLLEKINTPTGGLFIRLGLTKLPSYEERIKPAVDYYKKAFAKSKNPAQYKRVIHHLLKIAPDIQNVDLIKELCPDCNKLTFKLKANKEWEILAELLLVRMHHNLLSYEGSEHIKLFVEAIHQLDDENYLSKERCLDLLDQAIKLRGNIKELFIINEEYNYRTRSYEQTNIECTKPDMVNEDLFLYNVGAGLHFLKAEIMQKLGMHPHEILTEYGYASIFAPQNPFGIHALFLIDNQKSQADHLPTMIQNERDTAIAWGSAKR